MSTNGGPTHISQIAMVVRDLDENMKMLYDTLGWGPWNVYEHVPPTLHHTHLRGESVAFSMLGAECEVQPGLVVELVQPLDGPSIYKEHLEKYGEGVQHIACMSIRRRTRTRSRPSEARGAKVLMGGRIGDTIEFFYLDTEPMLKFVTRVRQRPRHRPDPGPHFSAVLIDSRLAGAMRSLSSATRIARQRYSGPRSKAWRRTTRCRSWTSSTIPCGRRSPIPSSVCVRSMATRSR